MTRTSRNEAQPGLSLLIPLCSTEGGQLKTKKVETTVGGIDVIGGKARRRKYTASRCGVN